MSWAQTGALEMSGHVLLIALRCSALSGLAGGRGVLLLLLGSVVGCGLSRSAEIGRAQKHCHLLSHPGAQRGSALDPATPPVTFCRGCWWPPSACPLGHQQGSSVAVRPRHDMAVGGRGDQHPDVAHLQAVEAEV